MLTKTSSKIKLGFTLLFCVSIIYGFIYLNKTKSTAQEATITPTPTVTVESTPEVTPEPTPEIIVLNEKPVKEGAKYFEKSPSIGGQRAYFAYPLQFEKENPPTLIVYSHGSNTVVTTNFSDQFMKDLRNYGEYFTSRGYAFIASNQHGANWGSSTAIQDTRNAVKWVKATYQVQNKYNLIGFSMGGLPTLNYAFKYSSDINKMALLAPTNYANTYTKGQITSLKNVPIKLWHGNADVNVPYSMSTALVNRFKLYGKKITLVTLKGKGHWDVDTELKKDIYEFYEE